MGIENEGRMYSQKECSVNDMAQGCRTCTQEYHLQGLLPCETRAEIEISARRRHRCCKLNVRFQIQCELYFCFIFYYLLSVTFLGRH